MTEPHTQARGALLDELLRHGHFIPSGEHGLYGRGSLCERIYSGVNALVTPFSLADEPEILRFPPLVPRRLLDAVGFTRNFPHLCGALIGIDTKAPLPSAPTLEKPQSLILEHTGLAMLPAACYPAYPAIATRGALPPEGATLDLGATCVFRNEPSDDPVRLQVFHQRELVRIGDTTQVLSWRRRWMERAASIYRQLDLEASFAIATDPFFGRGGRLLTRNQRDAKMKYEAVVPIAGLPMTAVTSFNYHGSQLAAIFGLTQADGSVAQTACVGFGLERLTIALFDRHGSDARRWPDSIRRILGLESA